MATPRKNKSPARAPSSPVIREAPSRRAPKRDEERARRKKVKADYTAQLAAIHGVEVEPDDSTPPPVTMHVETAIEERHVDAGPRTAGPALEKPVRLRSRTWLAIVKADPCEMRDCGKPADDPHHTKVRGRRRDDFDPTAIPLCRRHHDDAHAGRISRDELHRMLGAYLVRKLPRLTPSEARAVLSEMLAALG